MNYFYDKNFIKILILTLLASGVCYGDDISQYEVTGETVIVTAEQGENPGQFYYWVGAGFNLCPRCFAIDSNDGAFYIPELDTRYNIRLHKFDNTGKFVDMLKLERKARVIDNIAVDLNGDIYLNCKVSNAGCHIIRYDKNGKLLNSFGAEGPTTTEDVNKSNDLSPENESYRNKFFRGGFKSFSVVSGCLEFVCTNEYHVSVFYRFDGRTGQVIGKSADIPVSVQKAGKEQREKYDVLSKLHFKQERQEGISDSTTGTSGEFYYMGVSGKERAKKLKICKVSFNKK